jgi:CRISPR/Cas system-associated protein endoribonuclease Cas2
LKLYLAHDLVQSQYNIQKAARNFKKDGLVASHFVKQGYVYVRFKKGGLQLRFDSVEDFEAAVKNDQNVLLTLEHENGDKQMPVAALFCIRLY